MKNAGVWESILSWDHLASKLLVSLSKGRTRWRFPGTVMVFLSQSMDWMVRSEISVRKRPVWTMRQRMALSRTEDATCRSALLSLSDKYSTVLDKTVFPI